MKNLKLFLWLFIGLVSINTTQAQSKFLQKIQSADLVFEGQITGANSFEKDGKVYTKFTAEVYKNFKNASASKVNFIAYGGQTQSLISTHSGATPKVGNSGIFIARKNADFNENYLDFNGVISYGIQDKNIVLPDGSTFSNTEKLYEKLYAHGLQFSMLKNQSLFENYSQNGRTEADLEIVSLIPLEITGGTHSILTINGKGFGDEIGQGNISFTKNEDGGQSKQELISRFWGSFGEAEVVSWSDEKIEVYVPNFAGSGTIIVKNDAGETFESLETLNVPYSLSTYRQNYGWFPGSPEAQSAQNPDLVNNNGKGGYTLFVDPEFFRNPDMLQAFTRALTTWRCATGINIKLASSLEKVEFGYSGKNAVTLFYPDFDTEQTSFMYSNYQVCDDGKNSHVRLTEFQLFFNANANWNFSSSAPSAQQLDFESEALRLLGKIAQVENINDPSSPMYYKLEKGESKRNLTASMEEGANLIVEQSQTENDCGPTPIQMVENSDCQDAIDAPVARFEAVSETEFCEFPVKIAFEDFSKNVTAWEWTISGANPEKSTKQNPTFEITTGGNYTVSLTVTGANGEKSTETKTDFIKVASQDVTVDLGDDLVICQNQKVTLDAGVEDATYEWSNGVKTQTLSIGIAGTYSVTVTKGGCVATDEITIKIDQNSAIEAGENTKICRGASTELQAKGGNGTFRWLPETGLSDPTIANPIASPDSTTIYRVYSDSEGDCGEVYDSIRVTVEEAPEIYGLPENGEVIMCGGQARAFIGAYSDQENLQYQWSNGVTESYIEVFDAGEYSVIVTSPAGCQIFDTINVIRVDEIVLEVPNDTTFCEGEEGVLLEAKGASFYRWEPTQGLENPYESTTWANPKETTTYTVTGFPQGFGECEPATAEIKVTVLPRPTLDLGEDEITVCEPEIVLDAKNEGGLFQWSNGSQEQTITITKSGTYFVTVTPEGCTTPLYDSIKVYFPELSVDLGEDTVIICDTESYMLDAQNSENHILWSDGSTSSELFVTASGVYSVEITHPTCQNTVTDTITVLFPRVESTLPEKVVSCENSITISANETENSDAIYEWSNGDKTSNTTISESGEYIVKITSKMCPIQTISDTIQVLLIDDSKLKVDLGEDQNACKTLTLDAENEGANYLWSDGSTEQTLDVSESGTYFVSVNYECGKTVTDEITVHFFKNSTVDFSFESEGEATTFTPIIDSKHAVKFEWNFGDNSEINNEQNPSHIFSRISNYEVTLTIQSTDCESEPISVTKNVNFLVSGVEEALVFGKLDVYPNPTQNQMTLRRTKTTENVSLQITDLTGKILLNTEMETGQNQKIITLDGLPNGIYFLKMQTQKGVITRKIIKE